MSNNPGHVDDSSIQVLSQLPSLENAVGKLAPDGGERMFTGRQPHRAHVRAHQLYPRG